MFLGEVSPRLPPPPAPSAGKPPIVWPIPIELVGNLDGRRAIPVGEGPSLPVLLELRLVSA